MAKAKTAKPFSVKGVRFTSPRGEALWCKVTEPDYQYNAKGVLSTKLVCDPNDPAVKKYIEKLEDLRDKAYDETVETLGKVKSKGVQKKEVFEDDLDADGEPTGNIVFKFQMKDVDDKKPGQDKIKVVDGDVKLMKKVPLVGNGSIIKCGAFANPYYMASSKMVGISLIWETMQLIKLVEFGGSGVTGFDVEDDADDLSDYEEQDEAQDDSDGHSVDDGSDEDDDY